MDKLQGRLRRYNVLLVLEYGIGASVATFLAFALGLKYYSAAGILVLLTIQTTRHQTLRTTLQRYFAFFLMVVLSWLIIRPLNYTVLSFGLFVLVFVALCIMLDWTAVMPGMAVLATHFLLEREMSLALILNEFWLLMIGAGIGVFMNFIMPYQKEPLAKYRDIVDTHIGIILSSIARRMHRLHEKSTNPPNDAGALFAELNAENEAMKASFNDFNQVLSEYQEAADYERANRLQSASVYPQAYFQMRSTQAVLLQRIWQNLERVTETYDLSLHLSRFIQHAADSLHELNNAERLIAELLEIEAIYVAAPLPETRAEFENRALLFVILEDIQMFLQIKYDFAREMSERDVKRYWY